MEVHVVILTEKTGGNEDFTRVRFVSASRDEALAFAHSEWEAERKEWAWTYASDGIKHNLILDRKMSVPSLCMRKTWMVCASTMKI